MSTLEIGDLVIFDGYLGEVFREFAKVVDMYTGEETPATVEAHFEGMPCFHPFVKFVKETGKTYSSARPYLKA